MFNPTRDEVRRFFCETWRKHAGKSILSEMETLTLDIILAHPEYHAVLENPDLADKLDGNPFLHMSLHLALAEQLQIDQPPGIRACYDKRLAKAGSPHAALHSIMDCLEEMLWHARNNRTPPDPHIYFECIDRHP